MPSGGSHSGGGSHGGHSGGSAHGGGFGGGSFGGGGFRRGPHYTVFMGRRVYVSGARSNVQGLFSLLMVLAIFVIFFSGAFTMVNVSQVNTITNDYNLYQNMITIAEREPENLIIEAEVYNYKYYRNTDKYQILYRIHADDGSTNEGYSFYVYTYAEVSEYLRKGTVTLAVNQHPTTEFTDSIPLDFKNKKLEDDIEFVEAKKGKTISIAVLSVGITLFVGCIIGNFMVLKTAKSTGPDETKTETQNTPTPTDIPTVEAPKTWKCAYCGKVQSTKNDICKQCGASRQE